MSNNPIADLEPRQRRRLLATALLRATLTAAVLVVLYYNLPLDDEGRLSGGVRLFVVAAVFVAVLAWQIRMVLRSTYPGIKAVETLAVTVPLFLLLFAATYFLMSSSGAGNFSQEDLTRTDTLYLTVTIFSTVGFGDISATSQTARLVVTAQMILDLVILGFGINAVVSAAKIGRRRQSETEHVGEGTPP